MQEKSAAPWFRELFEELVAAERTQPAAQILQSWTSRSRTAIADLRYLAQIDSADLNTRLEPHQERMWNLYALSRVIELLLLPFQPVPTHERLAPTVQDIGLYDIRSYLTELGAHEIDHAEFHPFFHEIAAVASSHSSQSRKIKIRSLLWPGFMLGNMILCRAGVVVELNHSGLDAELLQTSTLYWAWRRRHRCCDDLSKGWGSNSQWRTSFRRDLLTPEGMCIYNADGEFSLNEKPGSKHKDERSELRPEDRFDLVLFRCQVRPPEITDLWPYHYRYREPLNY